MGCSSFAEELEELPTGLLGNRRHLMLVVLDGLGWEILQRGLPFMDMPPEIQLSRISSVFPPTTAAALTSIYTGLPPKEHGYMGWTLYLRKRDYLVNVLPGYVIGKGLAHGDLADQVYGDLPLRSLFTQVQEEGDGRSCFLVSPHSFRSSSYSRMVGKDAQPIHYKREKDFIRALFSSVKKHQNEKTFTLAYSENPDKMIHKSGTESAGLQAYLVKLSHDMCKLASRLRGTDTLVSITADHGLVPMNTYHSINEIPEIMELLVRPPFPESRFCSFFVKSGKKEEFRRRFMDLAGGDFWLLEREEFLELGLLGPGKEHPLLESFLGDFIAIALGGSGIKHYGGDRARKRKPGQFKAHHAGITAGEMQVPLMVMDFPEE